MAEPASEEPGTPARLTPYELVFAAPFFAQRLFPDILRDIEEGGLPGDAPDAFAALPSAGPALKELLGEEQAAAAGASIEALKLLYHAFQLWRFGSRLYVLEAPLARHLVEAASPIGVWELTPPHPAGYLQLPRHLFWSRIDEAATPEPVDGFFWAMVGTGDPASPPFRRIDLLLALGLRPDRAGLSVIDLAETLEGHPVGHWADGDARPEGRDFANVLPGGDLAGMYALVHPTEVLKLVSLCFWYAAAHPEAVAEPDGSAAPAAPPSPHEFHPTALAYHRLGVVGSDG